MITIDITMPIQIINVLILIVILNGLLYKPIRSILAEREKKIADLNREVENFNKNATLRMEEFNQKLNEARSKGKAELDAVRSAAQASGNEVLAGVRAESDAKKAEQLAQIKAQFTSAQQELKGQVEGFAKEMASKVLGRALS